MLTQASYCLALLLPLPLLAAPDAAPDLSQVPTGPDDPENPDFSGMVDFSNATPGPDGSWCITKVKYVDHMEQDQVKECWHQNVTQCHDTYITEFLPSQEQKCEESFWKSCKIDFKETPFNYTLKQCHTPLIKECSDGQAGYGAPQKTVCRTWFESECNTTYVQAQTSDDLKPNTWCQKMPRKICAPDNCNMIQGPEDCRDKMMVSTIQKPEEHCELQPQRHCRLITKLVPHLTTKQVCSTVPKEICMLKLVNPHPVKKPIQLKWCTKKKPQQAQYGAPSPDAYGAPRPPSSSYLPAAPPPQFTPAAYRPPHSRQGSGTKDDPFVIDADQFQQLQAPPGNIINLTGGREQFRQVRQEPEVRTTISMHGDQPVLVDGETREVGRGEISWKEAMEVGQRREEAKFHRPSGHPPGKRPLGPGMDMYAGATEAKVRIVLPQPGSNNAHRVDLPFAKEVFQPVANSIQGSLTLPPSTLAKESSLPLDLTSPPPPLPTAYIPALSTFAPPPRPPTDFSPPPKLPTTTTTTTTTVTSSTTSPSSSTSAWTSSTSSWTKWEPHQHQQQQEDAWEPRQPRRQAGRRRRHQADTKRTVVKSSLRNHPGSIF